MAVPAGGIPSEIQSGDTIHTRGGQGVDFLTGAFIKSVTVAVDETSATIVYQDASGVEQTIVWEPPGGSVDSGELDRLKALFAKHDEVTEVYDTTIIGRDLFGGPVGAGGIRWIDWFNGRLFGISNTHANGVILPNYPDGGAARDGVHWYFLDERALVVYNANLQGVLRSMTSIAGIAPTDLSRGVAVDADLAAGELAAHVWILHNDISANTLVVDTIVPAMDGTITASQTFTLPLADINGILGDNYTDLTDFASVRDIAVRGEDLFILFNDLATDGGHNVSAIVVHKIGGTGNSLTLTADSVRAEDVVLDPTSLVEAPGSRMYLADGSDVYCFRERHDGIGFVRNITGEGGPESDEFAKNDLQVDNDQPGAWISGRQKIVSTNPHGVFNFYTQSTYLGRVPQRRRCGLGPPITRYRRMVLGNHASQGAGATLHSKHGQLWEDTNILTLFGTGHQHVWLGVSATELAALLKVNDFDTDFRYVGEVRGDLVQLDNDTYIAGTAEHFQYPVSRLALADEIAEGAAKDALFTYSIAEGHDIDDTSLNSVGRQYLPGGPPRPD